MLLLICQARKNQGIIGRVQLTPNNTLANSTIAQAISHYGCDGDGDPCAEGEFVSGSVSGNVTLNFD